MVPRYSALPPWVWDHIRPHLAESGPCFRRLRGTGPVTPQQISQQCNDWLHKSGTNSTLHSLRHWAGSSGITVEDTLVVQSFLGHASPATTAVYAEVQPQRIAAMVDTFRQVDLSDPTPGDETANMRRGHLFLVDGGGSHREEPEPDAYATSPT